MEHDNLDNSGVYSHSHHYVLLSLKASYKCVGAEKKWQSRDCSTPCDWLLSQKGLLGAGARGRQRQLAV